MSVKLSDTLSAQVKVTGISATEDVLAGDSTPSPTAMGTRTKVFVFSDSLSTFIGAGTVHLQLSEHTTTAVTGASTVRYTSPRTSAGIEITVTYNYSRPTLVRFVETSLVDGGNSVEMTVVGPAQSLCRLEFISSLDLKSPSWEKVSEAAIPASGQVVFKVQNSKKLNGSFFRATIP